MPTRVRKKPYYKNFKLTKRIKPTDNKQVPTVLQLFTSTSRHIWRYRRIFGAIIAIYFLLNLIFVSSLNSGLDVAGLKQQLQDSGEIGGIEVGATLLGVVIGPEGSNLSEVASLYQLMFLVIFTLAYIWLFRQTYLPKVQKIKIKQPFYEGMTPLIKFIFTLLLISLQLMPMIVGISLFSVVQVNGLAATAIESVLWATLTVLLSILSLYWVSASLLALIIVTLPEMTPLRAYKNAKKIALYRRWRVLGSLILLSLLLIIIFGATVFATIMIFAAAAQVVVLLISSLLLPLAIGCGYKLYRSLI